MSLRLLATSLVSSLVLGLGVAACSSDEPRPRATPVSAAEAASLLIDRNWLDTWPRDKDDHLHVFRFTPSMGGGVYHDRTVFQGKFELFTFETQGDQLRMVFPHTGETSTTTFRIERVDGPAPFDLRLTLDKSPRGPRVYYGMSSETGDLDATLQQTPAAR